MLASVLSLGKTSWICETADFEDELHTLLQQVDELEPGWDVDDGPEFSYRGRTWRPLFDDSMYMCMKSPLMFLRKIQNLILSYV